MPIAEMEKTQRKYDVLVRAALEKQKQHRETVRQKTLATVLDALAELAQQVPFQEAFLFGSLVRPYAFKAESDVDIAFAQLSNEAFFFTSAFLSRRLGREVDVVQLEQAGRIRATILKEGIRWTKEI